VVVVCNYERRYSFCRLIERVFSGFDGVVRARVGRRWITIETIPEDVIKVKIPLLPREQLEEVLYALSDLAKRIQEYRKTKAREGG